MIENCWDCPHTSTTNIPRCEKKKKELQYREHEVCGIILLPGKPNWCPLENNIGE